MYYTDEDSSLGEEIPEEEGTEKEETPEEEDAEEITSFKEMYDFFLAGITDDMFMELTIEDTEQCLEEILLAAIPQFEFPRKDIFDVDLDKKSFKCKLDLEEKMILRQYMIVEWVGYQLASVDLVRQKYSGSDFSFTSQASHMSKLIALRQEYSDKGFHLQRLYNNRYKNKNGMFLSTFSKIMAKRDADDY